MVALAIASVPSLGAAQSAPAARPDVSGIWQAQSHSPRIKTVDGEELPFTAEGLAAYKQNIAGLKDGTVTDDALRVCLPPGVPRIALTPYPFQIFQNAEYVALVYEENHVFRNVLMDVPPAGFDELEAFPYYSGTSYGRWEGDTLIIETRGFNESTFIDATGVPHSNRLHVIERLRTVNDGRQLENLVTVEDPAIFTRPWSARFVYESRPNIRLDTSYTCGEPHRDLTAQNQTNDTAAAVGAPAGANLNGYWTNVNRISEYDRPYAGETGPIQDIRGMDVLRAEGRYVIYLGDYKNPILQPWAADVLRKHVEQELKGSAFHTPTPQEVCRSSGVPNVWTIPTSIQIVQTPNHVAILYQRDHQFRIVHMNQPHPPNLKPSYYGDSVGHWEGETLVVDTIGQSDKTPVDVFNTPHTDKIHVVERFQLVEGTDGNRDLWIHFTVNDPGAFTGPWSGTVHFRPIEDVALRFPSPMAEEVCAENNRLPDGTYPIPTEPRYRFPE